MNSSILIAPPSAETSIFISHNWDWCPHYSTMLGWLSGSSDISWRNCSFPCAGGMHDTSTTALRNEMSHQIRSADIVLILDGMRSSRRHWIGHAISESLRMGKTMIAIKHWSRGRHVDSFLESIAAEVIDWNEASVVEAVRRHLVMRQQETPAW